MPPRSSAALIGLALAAPLAVCAALSAARGTVESDNAVLVLVLVVVGVAASGSRLAGVVAALSSAAWFDYFLTRPFHHFTIADRDDVETAVLLTLVGIAVTEIALWGRRQQARLSERQGYLAGVISAADLVARGEAPPKVVLDFVGQQIVELLTIDSCTYAVGPPGAHARLERDGSITRDGSAINVDRSGLPVNDVVELPVWRDGVVLGRFVLTAASRAVWTTPEQRRVAVTLADQAGTAMTTVGRIPASHQAPDGRHEL
jgi:K+-sensing histidine kinase KdpD